MPTLTIDLFDVVSGLDQFTTETALQAAADQAAQELKRQISRWPIDSGRSKAAFTGRVRNGEPQLYNPLRYTSYVERGIPASRTRGAARRTLATPAARKRIIQAAQRGRASRERAQDPEAARRRRERDERIILEGGPDSRLSREGRVREASRRRRNRLARRRRRLSYAEELRSVAPWIRASGAEIRVAARLRHQIVSGIPLDEIIHARRQRPYSSRLITLALQLSLL